MIVVIIAFGVIMPEELTQIVSDTFPTAKCDWSKIDDLFYEFGVANVTILSKLEDILAQWV